MELNFGKISRKVAAQHDMDALWSTIVHEIPGLTPHRDGLQMRYIDDEGDDICVTTNDELQEGLLVANETTKGILSLNLSVPGMAANTRTAIEETVSSSTEHFGDVSTEDEEEYVEVPADVPTDVPVVPPRRNKANPTEPDVLQVLKNAGASAVSEINQALHSASTEIDKIFKQLGAATTEQRKTEQELATVKAELKTVNSKFMEGEQQVVKLTHELATTKAFLSESKELAKSNAIRLQDLENQVSEAAMWENKYNVAEKERIQMEEQLKNLRAGIQALQFSSMTKPTVTPAETVRSASMMKRIITPAEAAPAPVIAKAKPVVAEVVSNEIMPPSPVMKGACSPELPPAYEAPVASSPFPKDCPAPSASELKKQKQLQQLRDMGFHLTVEQLNEKLRHHGDDMSHVIHSLLR